MQYCYMNQKTKEFLEKQKEIEYFRINFLNKLKSFAFERDQIIRKISKRFDEAKIEKIKKELGIKP